MNQQNNEVVQQENQDDSPADEPVVIQRKVRRTDGEDNDNEDRKAARDFKFFALRTLTITLCAVVIGAMGSVIYTYTFGERDFNEGVLNSVFSVIVEIVKLFI